MPMIKAKILAMTKAYVRKSMEGDSSHDFLHIERVVRNAREIAKKEKADPFIVEMASLLHDIDDWKFSKGKDRAKEHLESATLDKKTIAKIMTAINEVSFKGAKVDTTPSSIEGKIVQDADRLDALGAIGIARCFSYGGYKGHAIYDPLIKPRLHSSFSQYKKARTTSINHFHEKLLLLKDRMNTKSGKKLAKRRHAFMLKFLKEFSKETGF